MITQQIIGTVNVSIPFIVLFYMVPRLLWYPFGPLGVAIIIGAYLWFLNYKQHKAAIAKLLFAPTDKHKELFDTLMRSCGLNPARINLKYAYTAEQFAMTMGNTVIIDPTCCSICLDDSTSIPVLNVFNQFIEPGLSTNAKARIAACKKMLTSTVQYFLFKHELGHVAHHFATKKLCIVFLSGTFAAYLGIVFAKLLLPINNIVAICAGMIIGGVIDFLLAYAVNLLFKYPAEKNADLFAAHYSSQEEIIAAAHFFAQLQQIRQTYKERDSILDRLPSSLASGYPTGIERSKYLLMFIKDK